MKAKLYTWRKPEKLTLLHLYILYVLVGAWFPESEGCNSSYISMGITHLP